MGLQPIDKTTQVQESKGLTVTGKASLQTSLQTESENSQKPTDSLPSELATIIAAWPELPDHIKQTIETLVGSVTIKNEEINL